MQPKNILKTDSQISNKTKRNLLLFVGSNAINICDQLFEYNYTGLSLSTFSKTEIWLKNRLLDGAELPVAIISDFALQDGNVFSFHYGLKLHEKLRNIPLEQNVEILNS